MPRTSRLHSGWPLVLGRNPEFPDPDSADAEGFVAIGGDFSAERLLAAYRHGIFPWTEHPISWWSPDPRAVIELEALHVPRSLARVVRSRAFRITRDLAFRAVMEGCAAPTGGRGATWISPAFIMAYCELHRRGHAHSLECWQGNKLVGGIYGVSAGGFFAGESMFHRVSNASKVALVHLVEHLRACGFSLFDIQLLTPVTTLMGGVLIPRQHYLRRLKYAVALDRSFGPPVESLPPQD